MPHAGVSQVCCSQRQCPCGRPLLTPASAGDTQTLKGRSGSVSVGSLGTDVQKILFEPSKCLWQVWGLILNAISPLLPSCWGFCFALGHRVKNIQKTKIMTFGLIISWQTDGKTMKTVTDFIFLGSKIIADGDCSHDIKRACSLEEKL